MDKVWILVEGSNILRVYVREDDANKAFSLVKNFNIGIKYSIIERRVADYSRKSTSAPPRRI